MPIEHIREYTIDCTGDVCQGDVILFSETVFGGSHRSPVALGTRRIAATVIRDSYGAGKQQHTFTLVVAGSDGCHALRRGATIRRKGRNAWQQRAARRSTGRHPRGSTGRQTHTRQPRPRCTGNEKRYGYAIL